ncbi:MAG: CinA family nicotinamide mononucleotide deamidase-related protein [Bacteroidetes bacterium]|nr:CinA family nicotinamide mononucleotide deamidase-related protein [Bacteroidota bacterium]
MQSIYCSIITIGDELLIGQTIDTNSAWIAKRLNEIGIQIKRRVAVGDSKEDILHALNEESIYADIIIITGGLGPTSDDITKPVLCEYFNSQLIENKEVLEHVIRIFTERKRQLLEVNLRQAMLPNNCKVLFNEVGTAPGMWFMKNEKIYISLPGVPFEMQHIITERVLPALQKHFITPQVLHRTIVTSGEGESFIANRLIEFEANLPASIKLAFLPKLGIVKLRLSAIGISDFLMDQWFDELKTILSNILVADYDVEIEQIIFNLLSQNNETLSIAESCTGGRLASVITSIKGSSTVFKGGIIPYSIEAKINVLNVPQQTIENFTAISEETALSMAENCLAKMNSTYAISVTGNLEKQIGETFVWIGLAKQGYSIAKKLHVFYDREKNAVLVTNTALNLLRLFILHKPY